LKSVAVCTEALTPHFTFRASHCGYCCCQRLHASNNTASVRCLLTEKWFETTVFLRRLQTLEAKVGGLRCRLYMEGWSRG
jgi:hypothetical protein